MSHQNRFSSDQLAHSEALRAYAAQVRADDDFRGDPGVVDHGRALIDRATGLGLPLDLYRDVQAIVWNYDAEAIRPPDQRASWFKPRRSVSSGEKREAFLAIVQAVHLRSRRELTGLNAAAGDAVAASHRIPADMTAAEAALAFCALGTDRDARAESPRWMAMAHDPL
jgi:hypothetical protein